MVIPFEEESECSVSSLPGRVKNFIQGRMHPRSKPTPAGRNRSALKVPSRLPLFLTGAWLEACFPTCHSPCPSRRPHLPCAYIQYALARTSRPAPLLSPFSRTSADARVRVRHGPNQAKINYGVVKWRMVKKNSFIPTGWKG